MERFLSAIHNGQLEVVRETLDKSGVPDLDYQDPEREGNSPLHLAVTAKRNGTRLVEALLGAGADCDLRNRLGHTPAERALEHGQRHVAEYVLWQELAAESDERAFLRLVRRGSVELLKIFLEKRAFDIRTKMKLIAHTLDELSVKGVPVAEPMRVFLEYELIAHSYETGAGGPGSAESTGRSSKRKADGKTGPIGTAVAAGGGGVCGTEADRRIELVRSYTKYLTDRYGGDNLCDLDDEFVVRLRAICDSLHWLEESGRKLPKRIPLAECAYLGAVFLAILERKAGFEIYKLVLNREMLLTFLRAVGEELTGSTTPAPPPTAAVGQRTFPWTPQLFLDLMACVREQRLAKYVARRRRGSADLRRISATVGEVSDPADRELLLAELGRREFRELREDARLASGWGVEEYVAYLRTDGSAEHRVPTVGQFWQRSHPKLRLSKRQVAYAASRRELFAKIRARRLDELSRNKTKLLERELTGREFREGAAFGGRTVCRRNRIVFRALHRTYGQLRRMHTVKQIVHYVENALVIDLDDEPNETLCLMAVKRVLQFIGDASAQQHPPAFARMLENILEHALQGGPATSTTANHPGQPPDDLRDLCSARCTVTKYFVGKAPTVAQVKAIQERLRAVYRFCLYVINVQLIEAYKTFLGTAYRLRNRAQQLSYARFIGEHNLHTLSSIQFVHVFYDEPATARTIHELKRMYAGMANELKLLSFIEKNIHFRFYHMQYHQTRLRVTLANFAIVCRALRANPDYGCVRALVHSYLRQAYQKYDLSRSISISDANLALKELLRPYSSLSENEDSLKVVHHLEELQSLMNPDCLFGIDPVRCVRSASPGESPRLLQFTRKLVRDLNLPALNDEEFEQLHEKLRRAHYGSVFGLQARYRLVEDFVRAKGGQTDALGACRERDEELLQELFDAKVNDVVDILEKFECTDPQSICERIAELPAFVQFALEFGVLELLEILASAGSVSAAVGRRSPSVGQHWPTVVLSGRNLRTYLAAGSDALVIELLSLKSSATIFLNAIIFKQVSFRLYGGGARCTEGGRGHASGPMVSDFEEKFTTRLRWIDQQKTLFEAVRAEGCELNVLREHVRNGADIDGTRLGSVMTSELCHYGLIDYAIMGSLREMIDLLTRSDDGTNEASLPVRSSRRTLLQYLLRRTRKSHFVIAPMGQLREEDRRMLVLYLCMFLGDVDLFRSLLDRYGAHDQLHLFMNSNDHEFVDRLLGALEAFDWSRTDANGMTVLQTLINAGNVRAVRALVGRMSSVQLNALCSMKYSAINLAARLNLIEIVRLLAEAKVDVNAMSEDEKLPVFWLIQYGNSRNVVRLAIDAATELTAFSSELCLLHRAIEYDNVDVLRYLLEDCKVDPSRIYSNCNNVLHAAAGFDRSRTLHYLLALPSVRKLANNCNLVKNTPLSVACKERHIRSAKVLLEVGGAATDPCGEYGLNALAFALYTNNSKLARLLLRHGASISSPLSSDFQPINMAIRNRNIRLLEFLLRRGVDPNSAPLCFINAVSVQSRDIVRLLIARGVRHVNHKDEFCQTALHRSVECNEHEIARDLIHYGAAINAKDRSGRTPLHLAVERGDVRMVQLLLDSPKCSVDELNYHGETPLIRAVVGNNLALVKILLNNGASVERLRNSDPPVLLYLVQENHEEILDYLLEHYQFDANEQDAYGNSLLYVATQHNHINIVKLLVDKYHARTNPANHKKLTPIMIARVKEYKEIFHFLAERLVEE